MKNVPLDTIDYAMAAAAAQMICGAIAIAIILMVWSSFADAKPKRKPPYPPTKKK